MIAARFSRNRIVGIVAGAGYVVIGALGFLVTGGVPFASTEGGILVTLLEVNPLQNLVHIGLGLVLLAAGIAGHRVAVVTNTVIGVVAFALGFYGLFAIDAPTNVLALNTWGNALHFGSAAVLVAVGLGADRTEE
jgi:hypothetical protein